MSSAAEKLRAIVLSSGRWLAGLMLAQQKTFVDCHGVDARSRSSVGLPALIGRVHNVNDVLDYVMLVEEGCGLLDALAQMKKVSAVSSWVAKCRVWVEQDWG